MEFKFINEFLSWDALIKKVNSSLFKFFGIVLGGAGLSKFFEVCDKFVELRHPCPPILNVYFKSRRWVKRLQEPASRLTYH